MKDKSKENIIQINHDRNNMPTLYSKVYCDNLKDLTIYEYSGNDKIRGFEINISNIADLRHLMKLSKMVKFIIIVKFENCLF